MMIDLMSVINKEQIVLHEMNRTSTIDRRCRRLGRLSFSNDDTIVVREKGRRNSRAKQKYLIRNF